MADDDVTTEIPAWDQDPGPVDEGQWGLNPNTGKPYQRDPAIYAKRSAKSKRTTKRRMGATAPKRKTAAPSTPKTKRVADYQNEVEGLIQTFVILPLSIASMRVPVLAADVAAVDKFAPDLALAVAEVAETNEAMARVIGKAAEVGPYGALIMAVSPLMMQLATNHGLIPVGTIGTQHPNELITEYAERKGIPLEPEPIYGPLGPNYPPEEPPYDPMVAANVG